MCDGGTPSEGGDSWECGLLANRGMSIKGGWKLVSIGCVGVFQVILAYESIGLCKCSGKYSDIYFSLKITYQCVCSYVYI